MGAARFLIFPVILGRVEKPESQMTYIDNVQHRRSGTAPVKTLSLIATALMLAGNAALAAELHPEQLKLPPGFHMKC